jgi:hypothetical protein
VISALIGVALACLTMAAGVYFWIIRGVRNSIRFIAWIGWQQTCAGDARRSPGGRSACGDSDSGDY